MKTIISNQIYIENVNAITFAWIQDTLTVTNPTWATLKRIGKEDTIRFKHIPEKMNLYSIRGNITIVPFGVLSAIWTYIKDYPYELRFNDNGFMKCRNDKIAQPLFDYQEEAVQELIKQKGGLLSAACGAGKTQIGLELAHRIGRKFLWLTHTHDLLNQTLKRANYLYPNMKIGTITEGKVDIGEDGAIATVQTLANIDEELYKNEFDVVIVDECFPSGTKVSVKNGHKNIEDIKVGDEVLSFNHKTQQQEYKKVTHLFVKTSHNLTQVKIGDKMIVSTSNHPFYTQRGYVQAGDLKYGDYVLHNLWKSSNKKECFEKQMEPRKEKRKNLLFRGMCEKQNEKETVFFGRSEKSFIRKNEEDECFSSGFYKKTSRNEMEQSNERRKKYSKNDYNKRKEWNFSSTDKKSRWKWENKSVATNGCRLSNGKWDENNYGNANSYWANERTKKCISNMLQDRCCDSRIDDSNRGRWRKSQWKKSQRERYEENELFDWQRVESVSSFEQTSQEGHSGSVIVYNIEVEDNNNYFVDDILVHNCHHVSGSPTLMKYFSKIINKIPTRYKYGLTATPSRGDTMIKSMYAYIGCNKNGDFAPTYKIDKNKVNTLTAIHEKIDLETPESFEYLNTDGTYDYLKLIDFLSENPCRNATICKNIIELDKENRKQLVLCSRIEQCETLYNMLLNKGVKCELLVGKVSNKRREKILNADKDAWDVIVATFSLAKEGLDLPILDTLHLATPQKNKAIVVQSVGRIERVFEGKPQPIVYDYVDVNIPYCVSAYNKRKAQIKRRY